MNYNEIKKYIKGNKLPHNQRIAMYGYITAMMFVDNVTRDEWSELVDMLELPKNELLEIIIDL